MPSMTLKIHLGPLVYFQVEGENCREIADALQGFDELNRTVDAMCSDLAGRVYPDGVESAKPPRKPEGAS
jgi:hypothetical protein